MTWEPIKAIIMQDIAPQAHENNSHIQGGWFDQDGSAQ
jgi:hypothetical protein